MSQFSPEGALEDGGEGRGSSDETRSVLNAPPFQRNEVRSPACSLLNAGHLLLITAQKRDAISDHFQIRFHGSFLEGMEVSGQLCPNPVAELRGLTEQESLQVDCHWLDRGTAVNGDFWVQFSVKPANSQRGETEAWMNSEPKKSRQHCPQDKGGSSERTMEPPVGIRVFGDRELKLLFNTPPGKESRRSGPCAGAVEPGPDRAPQFGFRGQRSGLVRTFFKLDASDRAQQAQMATRHSVRVSHAVTVQPLAEILRFTDVKNRATGIAHEINAGALRQLPEELAAQPFDERLRVRKEKLLSRRHSGDSTRRTRKVQDAARIWEFFVPVLAASKSCFLTWEQVGTDAAWVARRRAAPSTHRLLLHPMQPSIPASLFAPWEICRQPMGPGSAASAGNEYCCAARSTCEPPPPASPSAWAVWQD